MWTLQEQFKQNYYRQFFDTHKSNLKKTWEGIKSIINHKSKTGINISSVIKDKKCIDEPIEIANTFNEYFSTIPETIAKKIIPSKTKFTDYLTNRNPSSIFLVPTTPEEVTDIISNIKLDKAVGPNSIPNNILHCLKNVLGKPISDIFNTSISLGIFPDCLKIQEIIPIHKKDSKMECKNYRPISLLSNLSKIFEKLLHTRLYKFLVESNSFYKLQFGFREKHSTIHALIKITESIQEAIDNKNFACGVFIDLQKAFDTVNHSILLNKLEYYGIRGLSNKLFQSYLHNRKQYVKINGVKSALAKIIHGVPQGSILGPLLFLIYINDLNNAIEHSAVFHFADDTNLLYIDSSLKKINKYINHDLKNLCQWLRANKISLNQGKTEILLFKSSQKSITKTLNFRMSGQKVALSNATKYLGVIIDENLTFKSHITQLALKLGHANGILSKIRHYVSPETLLSIYHAMFSSHLTYASQIWFNSENTINSQISKLQNKALRIMNFKPYDTPSTPLYKKLEILKIADHTKLLLALFIHDFLNNKLPISFNNFVEIKSNPSNTRLTVTLNENSKIQLNNLIVPSPRTILYGLQSIKYRCISFWNELQTRFNSPLSLLTKVCAC